MTPTLFILFLSLVVARSNADCDPVAVCIALCTGCQSAVGQDRAYFEQRTNLMLSASDVAPGSTYALVGYDRNEAPYFGTFSSASEIAFGDALDTLVTDAASPGSPGVDYDDGIEECRRWFGDNPSSGRKILALHADDADTTSGSSTAFTDKLDAAAQGIEFVAVPSRAGLTFLENVAGSPRNVVRLDAADAEEQWQDYVCGNTGGPKNSNCAFVDCAKCSKKGGLQCHVDSGDASLDAAVCGVVNNRSLFCNAGGKTACSIKCPKNNRGGVSCTQGSELAQCPAEIGGSPACSGVKPKLKGVSTYKVCMTANGSYKKTTCKKVCVTGKCKCFA